MKNHSLFIPTKITKFLTSVCHTVIVSFSQSTDHEKLMKLLIDRTKKQFSPF